MQYIERALEPPEQGKPNASSLSRLAWPVPPQGAFQTLRLELSLFLTRCDFVRATRTDNCEWVSHPSLEQPTRPESVPTRPLWCHRFYCKHRKLLNTLPEPSMGHLLEKVADKTSTIEKYRVASRGLFVERDQTGRGTLEVCHGTLNLQVQVKTPQNGSKCCRHVFEFIFYVVFCFHVWMRQNEPFHLKWI